MTEVAPTQALVTIRPGQVMMLDGREVVFIEPVALNKALVQYAPAGVPFQVDVHQLKIPDGLRPNHKIRDYESYSCEDRREAERRFAIIEPLIKLEHRSEADVERVVAKSGFSKSKIYEMIRAYADTRSITSLIPQKRGRRKAAKVIPGEVESVIASMIKQFHMDGQKRDGRTIHKKVKSECIRRGLPVPTEHTVRNRIARTDPKYAATLREGRDRSKQLFDRVGTGVPNAGTPLAFAQIDHTKVNIVVVDEIDRQPLGRPWITLIIDVRTRVVLGLYISLHDPGYVSVGAAISHALLPKRVYLNSLDLDDVEWPVWGAASRFGADNGSDFRSDYLTETIKDYPFDIEWRPLGDTHFGGHIERLMGTFSNWIAELPGATWASPKERGDYDSDAQAAMTLRELEKYVVRHICEIYHKEPHSGLGDNLTPLRAWEQGLMGTASEPGIGFPAIFDNPDRVRIDFLPFARRVVTRAGISFKTIPYQGDALNPMLMKKVQAVKSAPKRTPPKELFRWDPRDITCIWVWDDTTKCHANVPIAERSMPPMSMSEYQRRRRILKDRNVPYDPHAIAQHALKNEDLIAGAIKRTKKVRREEENRRTNQRRNEQSNLAAQQENMVTAKEDIPDQSGENVLPFNQDIEL